MRITQTQLNEIITDIIVEMGVNNEDSQKLIIEEVHKNLNEIFFGKSNTPTPNRKTDIPTFRRQKNQTINHMVNNKLEYFARMVQFANDAAFLEKFKQLDAYITNLYNQMVDMKKELG